MAEYNFPTETIDLPSGGKFYPEGSPLRNGRVDVKYMTAKEEDILTSTNLILKGLVIDKLMESVIVTPGVKPEDLLVGDLNAITIAARVLAYGKEYPIKLNCGVCNTSIEHTVDLTSLDTIEPIREPVNGEYDFKLSNGTMVTFKLLTRADEKNIRSEIDALKKINNSEIESDVTTRLKYIITSVNGNRDKKVVREFAENILIRDTKAIREEYKKVSPDVSFDLTVECTTCKSTIEARMPFGANFLWPDLQV